MKSLFSAIAGMSAAVKIILALVVLTVLVLCLWFFNILSGTALIVLIVCLVVVLLVFMAFLGLLKMAKKRKAAPFERELAGNTGAVPSNISDASGRARMDDLRQKFMKGIEAFNSHGKDIYSLPWYAIVGEPGSGKTEALRHSNIGFPPGLQDELQGSGGTMNMDWWFTNHAIILDTAGRLMFDESASETNPEWIEFLKLLRKHRANCPINGLMLVIPADSVIKDTADQIQEKGGRIARQLDLIQRTLGVRFPVFILITKADLVNGFREFFDQLNDPQLQHQIMGWSNPGSLDDDFNPEDVVDHLYTVQERLERRRLGLMLDPVSREGAMAKRLDEVDALFAFPESMANLAPRLRRYLELIFISGEWSSKPLFLRGIYFVSSMREGSALDADLAEAFGVDIDQLPEGRIWERDRSYFLRDLFLMKMFRERGLVTRTSNTGQLKRKRRAILLTTGIAASILLLGLTWWQTRTLDQSIVQPSQFWASAADIYTQPEDAGTYPSIVGGQEKHHTDDKLTYLGDQPADYSNRFQETIASAMTATNENVQRSITVPLMFRPVAWFSTSSGSNLFQERRKDAGRALFELSVLRPLLRRAVADLGDATNGGPWSPEATKALIEVMQLYALNDEQAPRPDSIDLAALFNYVLRPEKSDDSQEALRRTREDLVNLQPTFDQLYATTEVQDPWPGSMLTTLPMNVDRQITAAIDRYASYVRDQWQGVGRTQLADAVQIQGAIVRFNDIRAQIIAAYDPAGTPQGDLVVWRQQYPQLGLESNASATSPYAVMNRLADEIREKGYRAWHREIIDAARAATQLEYDAMLGALPPAPEAGATPSDNPIHQDLLSYRRAIEPHQLQINEAMEGLALTGDLEAMVSRLLAENPRTNQPIYRERGDILSGIEKLRNESQSAGSFVQLAEVLAGLNDKIEAQRTSFAALRSPNPQDEINTLLNATNHLLDLVRIENATQLIDQVLATDAPPNTAQEVADLVRQMVEQSPTYQPIPAPALEMTIWRNGTINLNDQYHQNAGPACVDMLASTEASLRARSRSLNVADALRNARLDYVTQYISFWRTVLADSRVMSSYEGDWSRFWGELNFDFNNVNNTLVQFARLRRAALQAMAPGNDWPANLTKTHADAVTWFSTDIEWLSPTQEFTRKCDLWRRSWRSERTGNFDIDRQNILQLDSPVFLSDALCLYGTTSTSHYVDYWRNLTMTGLNVLALASENITRDAEQTLAQLPWFPLAPLSEQASLEQLGQVNSPEHQMLTWDQVLQAREAFNKIRPQSTLISGGAPATFANGSIGHPDTQFQILEIDEALRKLRGKRLTAMEQNRFERLSTLLNALPTMRDDDPLNCKITFLGTVTPTGTRSSVSVPLPLLRIDWQGTQPQTREFRLDRRDQDLGVEKYPGSERFVMTFSRTVGGGNQVVFPINGPWSMIALLHKYRGQRQAADPKIWRVEVLIPYQNAQWSLWLQLEFDTVLPSLDDWPR